MDDFRYVWCPECKCWIPADDVVTEVIDGNVVTVCSYCLGEKPLPYNAYLKRHGFVHDPNFGKVQCVYCDSYDTVENDTSGGYYCNNCNEQFRRFLL